MPRIRLPDRTAFVPIPEGEPLRLHWPTTNRTLFTDPARFTARTEANPAYGLPGWTRDCGKRFHRGLDVAPARVIPTDLETRVTFTDCTTGQDYDSEQPVVLPDDEVFAVAEGVAEEVNRDPDASDFGLFVVLRHAWPRCGAPFFTLYGHLENVDVNEGDRVKAGSCLARMGQTSRSADARNWMAIAPHLHLEAWDADGEPYDPLAMLRTFLAKAGQ